MNTRSLSVIIPALDEEGNIGVVCEAISRLAEKHFSDYEILVFDDASRDRTAAVVESLQKTNSHIILHRNPATLGLGRTYRLGVLNARCEYVMLIPGDNQVVVESLGKIFQEVGTRDVIVCFITNHRVRPAWRHIVSKLFTATLNLLFGNNLRYYNGTSIIRTDLAQKYVPCTSGYAYMAVMLVKLLKLGVPYKQMGFNLQERTYGSTKAFRIKNILSVIKNVTLLYWNVIICRQLKGGRQNEKKGVALSKNNSENKFRSVDTQPEECNV